ncbi:MAG: outer membrane lipoprotein chaperone LolA [Gammaproteobacteria bacterium]|nr:MAG: outer membrane lipoprotein chaperone LolA [Gammaproteobacteria bacterium]
MLGNLKTYLSVATLLLIAVAILGQAHASDAIQRLDKFFSDVNSFEGQFRQIVYDEDGEVVQEAKGDVALDKPGKFRWQYTQPYPQLILADGEYLWIYDEDLLQASAKPIDTALGNAPIMLLTNIRPLTDDFEVKDADVKEGLNWVELTPLVQDTEFLKIHIGLDENGVKMMELQDHFSQKTIIEFINLKTNVSFEPDRFKFIAAEGVDVVGYPSE